MKEEEENNADTYRFIDTSPPKKQLMAAIIHTELKKKKNKRHNIKVKEHETWWGEVLKERLDNVADRPWPFKLREKGK